MASGLNALLLHAIAILSLSATATERVGGEASKSAAEQRVIDVDGGPEGVVWVVQLSDLHFSVFHPDRALDFQTLVSPALSMVNPSLVLITGDLTDGKSKDLLIMMQNEEEWKEYRNIMDDVVKISHLDKNIFYDLRGNHDSFGVPVAGGPFDFFPKYSMNGQLGRSKNVNSVTLETSNRKHLFVGFESAMSAGLRGPTNLFGHPTEQILSDIDSELSQWDSKTEKPVTKITFGHFPISFSAASHSRKSLEDVFFKHSISAYLCGHLHSRFGKNLKRHHHHSLQSFQLNNHHIPSEKNQNCSIAARPVKEFWEWEMGDWRKKRAMRVLAIDRGRVSFVDLDFNLGAKKTIVLPTFPLDSRFVSHSSSYKYRCQADPSSYDSIRALIFSVSPVISVVVRIYDSNPGRLILVLESPMGKHEENSPLYAVKWNFKAFEDSSPDRYWLQIEVVDATGRSSLTELRPFSINGLGAQLSWTWREFFVMGCQWDALYYPIMWLSVSSISLILLTPGALFIFSKTWYNYKSKWGWIVTELCNLTLLWFGMLGYLFYLVWFPWISGQVFIDDREWGYMTYRGWVLKASNRASMSEFIGSPDIMVVVLPHFVFAFLPAILASGALCVERGVHRMRHLTCSGKKDDDGDYKHEDQRSGKRWIRLFILLVCCTIFWKHFMRCRALAQAYTMNPFLHAPVYTLSVPSFLAYAAYATTKV